MLGAYAGMALVLGTLAAETPPATPHAPASAAQCQETLRAAGLKFSPWPLRPSTMPNGVVCEAPDGIAVMRGPTVRYQPAARVNCVFAQRLVRFEQIVDQEARAVLRGRVRAILQLGTYNCRRMAAYPDLVSEHSFANAIDVAAFVLADGRRVDVQRDWVRADQPAPRPPSQFLRRLTRRLYDEQVFTVVLTPSYDKHHKNHLHLDGAAYSVDGT
jgi:hypothetical protein